MSDVRATERIIGGMIVVGVSSLLAWNAAQGGASGLVERLFYGGVLVGTAWAAVGLYQLFASPRSRREDVPASTSLEPNSPGS